MQGGDDVGLTAHDIGHEGGEVAAVGGIRVTHECGRSCTDGGVSVKVTEEWGEVGRDFWVIAKGGVSREEGDAGVGEDGLTLVGG